LIVATLASCQSPRNFAKSSRRTPVFGSPDEVEAAPNIEAAETGNGEAHPGCRCIGTTRSRRLPGYPDALGREICGAIGPNGDVRQALANAERLSARSSNPVDAFANGLAAEILGPNGLRNRYLGDADSGQGVVDVTAPLTSLEQNSLLNRGRFSTDMKSGFFDADPHFKKGAD